MPDLEKVIRGLECCNALTNREAEDCGDCPYYDGGCVFVLTADALPLLKSQQARIAELEAAQTARVMTLEEVEKWIETPEERKDPIFVEYGKKMKFGRSGWRTGFFGFSPQHDTHSYGTVLRCWTSRPTDEQREAVKWE